MGRASQRTRPKVYYTHWVPPEGPALLKPYAEVVEHPPGEPPAENEIVAGARDAFALCFSVRDRVSASLLGQCPKLRIVSSFARGTDNIDIEAATRLGIWVATVDSVMTEPVADMTWALLMAMARKVVPGDTLVRSGKFRGWEARPPHPGTNVFAKTLGIIGMGQVGRAVARRAAGFSMRVLCWQPQRLRPEEEAALGAIWVTKQELLAQSDFICLCSPLSKETYHQIGPAELQTMKPTAILVNTSRGSEVDEEAVARALEDGRLAGYASDVFEMEDALPPGLPACQPVSQAIPPALLAQVDRTVFTPHACTAVTETRIHIARAQAKAVLDVLQGRRPSSAVNDPDPAAIRA